MPPQNFEEGGTEVLFTMTWRSAFRDSGQCKRRHSRNEASHYLFPYRDSQLILSSLFTPNRSSHVRKILPAVCWTSATGNAPPEILQQALMYRHRAFERTPPKLQPKEAQQPLGSWVLQRQVLASSDTHSWAKRPALMDLLLRRRMLRQLPQRRLSLEENKDSSI